MIHWTHHLGRLPPRTSWFGGRYFAIRTCLVNLLSRVPEQSLSFLFDSLKIKGSSEHLSFRAHFQSKVIESPFILFSTLKTWKGISLFQHLNLFFPMSHHIPDSIYWLFGAWPTFRGDLAKQILVLLALSTTVHKAQTEISPEVVWEGARTRFPHRRDVAWVQVVRSSTLLAHRYTHFPVPRNLRCCLHITLLGGRTLLLPKSLLVFHC